MCKLVLHIRMLHMDSERVCADQKIVQKRKRVRAVDQSALLRCGLHVGFLVVLSVRCEDGYTNSDTNVAYR